MYSFVIKIAIDVKRAMELDIIRPTLGLTIDSVLDVIVEADPNKMSVIIKSSFFLFKLYFFLKNSLSILSLFEIFS